MFIELDKLSVNETLDFKYNVYKDDLLDNRIHDLKDSFAEGRIYINCAREMILECEFYGTMFIEDSISLEFIPYEFNIVIEENLDEIEENYIDCIEKGKNILDLKSILWQNIVLEVPISYTKVKDAELKGNGWELLNEEKTNEEIDPRLKKLEDLLKGDD